MKKSECTQPKVRLGITMGDPCGIGAEIIVKALINPKIYDFCRPIVIGSISVIENATRFVENTGKSLDLVVTKDFLNLTFHKSRINVLNVVDYDLKDLKYGQITSEAGRAAGNYIKYAVDLALSNSIEGIVTAPINKSSLKLGGYSYPGHTEMLADLTNTSDYAMMLSYGKLKVIHLSTHVSLREACNLVKKENVYKKIVLADKVCNQLGIKNGRIAVASLNPHQGENDLFGSEEREEILPAIEKARLGKINIEGPFAPDILFPLAIAGKYDVVLAMYHDQGHIPLKIAGFEWEEKNARWRTIHGVNTTIGLPIIRTSVCHGTAFRKAGKGIADETSLVEALEFAAQLAATKYR